jgi:predicted Zn-dependent protease
MGAILRILISTDKMPIADEFSKKWIKQYPDDAAAHYNRAWLASQIEGGSVQECIDGYRKAIELDPSLKSVHYNLGLVLLKAGKNTDALRELRAFVKALPEDSDSASARELIKKLE